MMTFHHLSGLKKKTERESHIAMANLSGIFKIYTGCFFNDGKKFEG